MIDLVFPYEKVTQAINYLAVQSGGQINKMKAIKLIYFADRYHLRKYGELITNDKYYGMDYGPVPSTTRDITVPNIFLGESVLSYIENYLDTTEQFELKSKKECDLDFISESEIEALDFAIKNYGDKDHYQLADISHDYPEWINIREKLKTSKRVEIDIMDFVKEPINRRNPCFKLSEEDRLDLLEELNEKTVIHSICE